MRGTIRVSGELMSVLRMYNNALFRGGYMVEEKRRRGEKRERGKTCLGLQERRAKGVVAKEGVLVGWSSFLIFRQFQEFN